MMAASVAIRVLPVRRLASMLRQPPPGRETAPPEEITVMCRAIRAWSRRLPWRTMCFEQGLAAHWMLRQRGFDSTLYYGAATIEGVLKAHVWVRSGDLDVVGCEEANDFALLARFPERQDADDVSAGSPHP
jgi:hypothetical protein